MLCALVRRAMNVTRMLSMSPSSTDALMRLTSANMQPFSSMYSSVCGRILQHERGSVCARYAAGSFADCHWYSMYHLLVGQMR